jgi:hypothetical protein
MSLETGKQNDILLALEKVHDLFIQYAYFDSLNREEYNSLTWNKSRKILCSERRIPLIIDLNLNLVVIV